MVLLLYINYSRRGEGGGENKGGGGGDKRPEETVRGLILQKNIHEVNKAK